jgi:hypothetical protein
VPTYIPGIWPAACSRLCVATRPAPNPAPDAYRQADRHASGAGPERQPCSTDLSLTTNLMPRAKPILMPIRPVRKGPQYRDRSGSSVLDSSGGDPLPNQPRVFRRPLFRSTPPEGLWPVDRKNQRACISQDVRLVPVVNLQVQMSSWPRATKFSVSQSTRMSLLCGCSSRRTALSRRCGERSTKQNPCSACGGADS